MVNKKALELAISTLILLILGILVLIGLIYFVTDGFKTLKSSTEPFLDTTQASSIKTACQFACDSADRLTFCCSNFTIQKEEIKCTDSRLEIQCNLNCNDFSCTTK